MRERERERVREREVIIRSGGLGWDHGHDGLPSVAHRADPRLLGASAGRRGITRVCEQMRECLIICVMGIIIIIVIIIIIIIIIIIMFITMFMRLIKCASVRIVQRLQSQTARIGLLFAMRTCVGIVLSNCLRQWHSMS